MFEAIMNCIFRLVVVNTFCLFLASYAAALISGDRWYDYPAAFLAGALAILINLLVIYMGVDECCDAKRNKEFYERLHKQIVNK